jgi:hypothetical protein
MTDLRSLTDEERAAMEVACSIEDHLAHQPEPRGACFRRGFLAALAYVREQEPSDEEVERAAKVLFNTASPMERPGRTIPTPDVEGVVWNTGWKLLPWDEASSCHQKFRVVARATLKAARER